LDMENLHRRGRDSVTEAGKLDAVERQLVAAEKRLQAAEKMLNKPGLSITDQDAARNEYEAAVLELDKARMTLNNPRQAAQAVMMLFVECGAFWRHSFNSTLPCWLLIPVWGIAKQNVYCIHFGMKLLAIR